jgi:hypothetical protein
LRASGSGLTWLLAAFAATALTFDDLLTGDRVPVYRDLLHIILPMRHYLAEHLRRGEIPLWNPLTYMGTPFLANLQSGVLYPPSVLLLLPPPLGSDLFIFAHYVIALTGMWMWLRGRCLSPASSAVGSLVFTLSGYLVSTMSVTPHLQGAAWAPWVLHAWERLGEARTPRRGVAFVLALCLQILSGSPENFLLTLVLLGVLELHRSFADRHQAIRRSLLLVGSLALAAGLSGVQLLPTIEYARHSARSGGLPYADVTAWSLQPVSLLQLLFPHSSISLPHGEQRLGPAFEASLAFLQSIYLGVVSLVLAVVGLARGRDRALWATVAAGGLVLALGNHTPVFDLLYQVVPFVFGKFRYPEKFLFIVSFALAFLAAEGMEALLHRREGARRAALAASAAMAAVALAVIVLRTVDSESYLRVIAILCGEDRPLWQFLPLAIDVAEKAQRLLLLLAALVGILVLRGVALGEGTLRVLLLALVAVDLFSAHRHLNLNMDWKELRATPLLVDSDALRESHERIFHYQTVASAPRATSLPPPIPGLAPWSQSIATGEDLRPFYRALWSSLPFNSGMFFGVANVSGGDAIARASDKLLLATLAALPRERAVELLRLCRVGYLIGPTPLDTPGVERVVRESPSPFYAYRIPRPLPPAQLVSRLRAIGSDQDALLAMTDPSFQAEKEAIVQSLPPGWQNGAAVGFTRLVAYEDSRVEIAVKSDGETFLVLNDSFFPGWEATVDRAPSTIYRSNVFFRGVVVPAGAHSIEFRYRPGWFYAGACVSLVSLGLLVVFARLLAAPEARTMPSRSSSSLSR